MKYKVITIAMVALFLSAGLVLACEVTPTPTEEVTPTVNPCEELTKEVVEGNPCETSTVTPTPRPGNVPENPSDGRSDGLSSCPDCTKAPMMPSAAPATGKASLYPEVGWK